MKKSLIALALFAAAGAASANAYYGFANVGQQRFTDASELASKSATQGKIGVGYNITPHVSAELAWQHASHPTSVAGAKTDLEGFSLVAKGRHAVSPDVNLTAKLGVLALDTEMLSQNAHDLLVVGGVGAEFKLSPSLALTAEYDMVVKGAAQNDGLNTFSVGLKHKF